jgi:hypothetical protein
MHSCGLGGRPSVRGVAATSGRLLATRSGANEGEHRRNSTHHDAKLNATDSHDSLRPKMLAILSSGCN